MTQAPNNPPSPSEPPSRGSMLLGLVLLSIPTVLTAWGGWVLGSKLHFAGSRWAGLALGIFAGLQLTRYLFRQAHTPLEDDTTFQTGEFDTEGRRHGVWTVTDAQGRKRGEMHYVHSVLQGPFVLYHPEGTRSAQGQYEEDKPAGVWTYFHPNGQRASEGEMRDQKRQGPWHFWDRAGQLISETTFVDDVEDGPSLGWYPGGGLQIEGTQHAGKVHGPCSTWYPNGQKESDCTFADGELDGPTTLYNTSGQKQYEAVYRRGLLHGVLRKFDAQGKETSATPFVHGVPLVRGFHSARDPREIQPLRPLSYAIWGGIFLLLVLAVINDAFISAGLIAFMVVLTIHELGHFVMAKLTRIPIQRFRIGMGPPLVRFCFGPTCYELSLIPILGFVQPYLFRREELAQVQATLRASRRGFPVPADVEVDASTDRASAADLASRPRALLFYLGGVLFNVAAAFLLLWAAYSVVLTQAEEPPAAPVLTAAHEAAVKTYRVSVNIFVFLPKALLDTFETKNFVENEPGAITVIGEEARKAQAERAEGNPLWWYTPVVTFVGLNLLLFCFNLLPIPPLDGFRCLKLGVEMVIRRELPQRYVIPLIIAGVLFLVVFGLINLYFMGRDVIMSFFR
jgi:antitoxin component YwqK of YwqJK toxin-antitoxin module/membrane-associated protease RseP (regulator of RpoE activity)